MHFYEPHCYRSNMKVVKKLAFCKQVNKDGIRSAKSNVHKEHPTTS